MKDKKMNNIGMKILSVMIAVLIWLLVANINDPFTTKKLSDIPVKIVNDEELTKQGYAYEVTEGKTVTVVLRGKNSVISSMGKDDIEAVADFKNFDKVDAVQILVSATKNSDQLEVSIRGNSIMRIKEEKTTTISVPVNVDVQGEAASGYAIGKTTGTPNLVKVTGPQHLLKNAKEIRVEIPVNHIDKEITTTGKPVLYDKDGEVIDSSQIDIGAASINVRIEAWKTKSVKVNLKASGKPASGYELVSFDYEPKTITIAAPEDILDSLDSIEMNDISLDGRTETYEDELNITDQIQQDNVKVVDESQMKVKAEIEKIITRTVSFSKNDITIKGKGNQKVAFESANTYSLVIEGASTRIRSLKIKDFDPWINVDGLEEGTHELTVHVKEVEGATVEQTARITVTLGE